MANDLGALQRCGLRHIEDYCAASSAFAWPSYDIDLTPGSFAPVELLAPALLSYALHGKNIVQPMLTEDDGIYRELYRAIETTVRSQHEEPANFGSLTRRQIETGSGPKPWCDFWAAWNLAHQCKHITAVGLTKILHRKAPDLVPIMDSRIHEFFGHAGDSRRSLRTILRIHDDMSRHEELVASWCNASVSGDLELKPLRAVDIAVWMHMGECAVG